VPLHAHREGGFLGSAHGWLFTTDEAANPYLLNPLTGARAVLPPIMSLERVRGSFVTADDDDAAGGERLVYNVDFTWRSGPPAETRQVTARRAREWMYRWVAVSASPLAAAARCGAPACVVLLVHMPYEELSFAGPATTAGPRSPTTSTRRLDAATSAAPSTARGTACSTCTPSTCAGRRRRRRGSSRAR
jgi:hypothetical protein